MIPIGNSTTLQTWVEHVAAQTLSPDKAKELLELCRAGKLYVMPGSSVSELYFAHPQACYFRLGKIDCDQVADYSARKASELLDSCGIAFGPAGADPLNGFNGHSIKGFYPISTMCLSLYDMIRLYMYDTISLY